MNAFHPWQLLVITLAGWINRHQQDVIDYLVEENRVLKAQMRGKRLRLTDNERRRLAVKGRALGQSVLEKVATIVTPDTIMRWYRQLVAKKWDYSSRIKRIGRPRIKTEIADLVLLRLPLNAALVSLVAFPLKSADFHSQSNFVGDGLSRTDVVFGKRSHQNGACRRPSVIVN